MPLPIILAGGAELALSGDGLVATIGGTDYMLRDSRDRRDFDLDGADVVGFRLTANGFTLVLSEVDRRGNESFSELGFITSGAVAVADRRPANLDAFDLTLLESQYEQDLNGDEADGFARLAELVASVDGAPSLHEITTGALGIGDGANTIAIVTDRGAPWSPPRGQEVIGVRADGPDFALLLRSEGSRGTSYSELEVDANGVVAGRATAVNEVDLLDKETAYGRDLDGDGEIGPVIAEEAVQLALNAAGDLSVYQQPSGLLGVSDAAGVADIVPLVTSRGQPWAPSQGEVIAVRANGPSVTVLTRGESGDFEYAFELVGGDHVQTGRPLSIDARELALREEAFDLDLNGDGVKGDTVTARLDSAVRNDGAELPLYKTAAGNYFFGPGDEAGATCCETTADGLPALAPSFPFTGDQPGTILRTSRDGLWDPNYEGANGEAVGIRATAVDGEGRPTAVAVLVRIESETGIVRYYEQPLTVDGASAQASADTSRWTQLDVAEAEALYLTDFDGDGEIDIREVDASAFQPPLTGLTLAGETVRMTEAQFAAVSAGDGVSGEGSVEVTIGGVGVGQTAIIDGSEVCPDVDLSLNVSDPAAGVVVAVTETEGGFTIKGFSDIQSAIDDGVTTSGTDIYVGAGTYAHFTVNKDGLSFFASGDVTVNGAGTGSQTSSAVRVEVGTDDTLLDGFTFTAGVDVAAVYAVGNNDGLTLTNNTLNGGVTNAFVSGGAGGAGLTNAVFDGNTFVGTSAAALVYVNAQVSVGATSSENTFTNNTFTGAANGGLLLGIENSSGASTVSGNTFNGGASYAAIEVFGAGVAIEGNSFDATAMPTIFKDPDGAAYDEQAIYEANTITGQPVILIEPNGIHAGPTEKAAMLAAGPAAEVREGVILTDITEEGAVERKAFLGTAGEDAFAAEADDQVYAGFGGADSFDFCGAPNSVPDEQAKIAAIQSEVVPLEPMSGLDLGSDLIVDFGDGLDKLKVASGMEATIEETAAGLVVSDESFEGSVTLEGLTTSYYQDSEPYTQGFETDTLGFFVGGDYGEIARVGSGTGGIASAEGDWHAVLEETASGPFSRLGGYSDVFVDGYTVTADIYLDTGWSLGEGFDVSMAASRQNNTHLRDFIFHVTQDTSSGDLIVAGSNNTNFKVREDLDTLANNHVVEESGWHTFEWVFNDDEGVLSVDMNLYEDGGETPVFTETRSDPRDTIADIVGGNRYMWFTDISVADGIAVDNVGEFIDRAVDREFIETCETFDMVSEVDLLVS